MSHCNSLSCGRHGSWVSCRGNWGCSNSCGCNHNCGCSSFGCVASDGTPACNPCAPWGSTAGDCGCSHCNPCNWYGWNGCANSDGCATCTVCGHSPCTCGNWCGCNQWNNCSDSGTSGCLIPRYRTIGRTFQRRITQTLCIDDIPDCAESPLTLVCVTVCGQATWEQISECRQQLLRVNVPVCVQIRDCAGRCRTGHATVTLTIPLCTCCPAQDFWRGQLHVAPCIRLAAPVTENEDGCFDATLEVQAEVFLVRMVAVNC